MLIHKTCSSSHSNNPCYNLLHLPTLPVKKRCTLSGRSKWSLIMQTGLFHIPSGNACMNWWWHLWWWHLWCHSWYKNSWNIWKFEITRLQIKQDSYVMNLTSDIVIKVSSTLVVKASMLVSKWVLCFRLNGCNKKTTFDAVLVRCVTTIDQKISW